MKRLVGLFGLVLWGWMGTLGWAQRELQVGFAKVDITPREKVRLFGYAVRKEPTDQVVSRLWARAMVIRPEDGRLRALVTLDLVGIPGALTRRVAEQTQRRWNLPRARLVLATTHTHTGPALDGLLENHLIRPFSPEEQKARSRYTRQVEQAILKALELAIARLQPARWAWAQTTAGFAVNRRLVKNGRYAGFGVNRQGPVDHSVPVLAVYDQKGHLLGVVFNYACHCTTLSPQDNFICGDWAGYACQFLEERFPGAVAMCTIGCAGDANPHPRPGLRWAKAHGQELADRVEQLLKTPQGWLSLPGQVRSSFGFAGLPFDRPSRGELLRRLNSSDVRTRRHAQAMLKILARKGRLPETYPCPVHVWRVGQLTMVFLGGEVVVDYALRLKRELPGKVWVSAYCDDVFAYVASRRVVQEGGYEADYSMLNYNQPGPWLPEVEDVLVRRVHQLLEPNDEEEPKGPQQALATLYVAPGLRVELAACEPLVEDPICIAFDKHLRLWVLEMRDYPTGKDGRPAGRVKILTDTDADGHYDQATVFLEGLSYPSGLLPWGPGAFVIDAPELFFAEDTNGDGRADRRQVLFRGFNDHNPQHQASSLSYGLDNWIYAGLGPPRQKIQVLATGRSVLLQQDDFRFSPDGKRLEPVTGRTQYGRTQDDWGRWFGSTNPVPFWHYVMPRRYLQRNLSVPITQVRRSLTVPASLPPVFPRSRTEDRFNDLFAANRFTSACGAHVYGDVALGASYHGHIFVCEPVHNLVHRAVLVPQGVSFLAQRVPQEQKSEFLASTDLWFRPVWIATGPDGALWVVDMYRRYIEHPQWIPDGWLAQIDVRAGEGLGRIYRIVPKDRRLSMPRAPAALSPRELVEELTSTNRWRRLMAQRLLVQGQHREVVPQLEQLLAQGPSPQSRLHALWTLQGLGELKAEQLLTALNDPHGQVRRHAVRLSEPFLDSHEGIYRRVAQLAQSKQPEEVFQVAFSLGQTRRGEAARVLVQLANRHSRDPWIRQAVLTSLGPHAALVARELLQNPQKQLRPLLQAALATLARSNSPRQVAQLLLQLAQVQRSLREELWRARAVVEVLSALKAQKAQAQVLQSGGATLNQALASLVEQALALAGDSGEPLARRLEALGLLGHLPFEPKRQEQLLLWLLQPQQAPRLQRAALEALARLVPEKFPQLVLQRWERITPAVRDQALQMLLQRRQWIHALLQAARENRVRIQLSAQARETLLRYPDAQVRRQAQELFRPPNNAEVQKLLHQYTAEVKKGGNPLLGALVFVRVCATCHEYRGLGRSLGPKLDQLTGQKRTPEFLVESILNPNAAVESKFVGYTLLLADGRVLQGLVVEENATAIQLADAQGRIHTVLRLDVEHLAATGKSFMPEGLHRDISPQQMAHLVAFLRLDAGVEANPANLAGWLHQLRNHADSWHVEAEPKKISKGKPKGQHGWPLQNSLTLKSSQEQKPRGLWALLLQGPPGEKTFPQGTLQVEVPGQGTVQLQLRWPGSWAQDQRGRIQAVLVGLGQASPAQAVLLVRQTEPKKAKTLKVQFQGSSPLWLVAP